MKPVSLANSPRNVDQVGTARFEKDRVLHRSVDEGYFTVLLAPGLCNYEGAVTEVQNSGMFVMRFPVAAAGVNAHAHRTDFARELWVRTRPRLIVTYTSPVGNVATFNLRFLLRVAGAGSGIGIIVGASTDFSPPGPAVANAVQTATVVLTGGALYPSSPFGLVLPRVGRLGGDANPNDLDILAAVVKFEEVA